MNRRLLRGTAFAWTLTMALLSCWDARAEGEAQRVAAERFREAQGLFSAGEYAAAATAFEDAARIAPHPAPLLNAAEAWQRANRPASAAADCDRALALPALDAAHRADAERMLAKLSTTIATLRIDWSGFVAIQIDGASVPNDKTRVRVAPGHHIVIVRETAEAEERSFVVALAAGETEVIRSRRLRSPEAAALPSAPVDPQAGAPERAAQDRTTKRAASASLPLAFWGAAGVAGLATVSAATSGLLALGIKTDFEREPTQERWDDFYGTRTVANVSWAVAGLAAGVAVAVLLLHPSSTRAPTTALQRALATGSFALP